MAFKAISAQKISLEDIASICSSQAKLMEAIMDPNSLAMIVGRMNGVTFTKLGSKVLSEIVIGHPLEKLIINAATQYYVKTGDDCKLFLLLLKEILHGTKHLLKKWDEVDVRIMLSKEISSFQSFLPVMFKEIFADGSTYIADPSLHFQSFAKHLEGIVMTSFLSKFPLHVSKELSKLICDFLLNSIFDWNEADVYLQYLISHFNVLCSKGFCPLSESAVFKGFLLNHRLISNKRKLDCVNFVLVWNLSRKSYPGVWKVHAETLPHHLSNLWVSTERSLNFLKKQDVSVILSPDAACENFESLCKQIGIIVISRIEKEDIENIIFFSGVSPLNFLHEPLEEQNICVIENISPVEVGNLYYTHLEILTSDKPFSPNQILLCSQLDDLWKEYYVECCSCLKVVNQWLKANTQIQQSGMNSSSTDKLILEEKIVNTFSLAEDSVISLDKLSLDSRYKNVSGSQCLGISFPLGLFEFSLYSALRV